MARRGLSLAVAAVAAAAAVTGPACGSRERARTPASLAGEELVSWSPPPRPGAVVIAEVNGEAIYEEDVVRQARARGLTAREALEELVAAELLAQEARRRGLAADPDVLEAGKRERVRLIADREFAPTFDGPEDVPDALVDQAWRNVNVRFNYHHERYQEVVYLHADAQNVPPEEDARIRAGMEELARRLRAKGPATKEEFGERGVAIARELGLEVKAMQYSTTRKGRAVEEFAAAAFSIQEIGGMAGPIRTAWGYDILYLYNVIPERKLTKAEAAPEIKQALFEDARRAAFVKWAEDHVLRARVVRGPRWEEWLRRIEVIAPVAFVEPGAPAGGAPAAPGALAAPPDEP